MKIRKKSRPGRHEQTAAKPDCTLPRGIAPASITVLDLGRFSFLRSRLWMEELITSSAIDTIKSLSQGNLSSRSPCPKRSRGAAPGPRRGDAIPSVSPVSDSCYSQDAFKLALSPCSLIARSSNIPRFKSRSDRDNQSATSTSASRG